MPVGIPLFLSAGEQGAQVAHLIGSILAPTHAASFHPLADDGLTGRFDRAGADRPPLGLVRRVVHPVHLVLEVTQYLAVGLPHRLAAVRGSARNPSSTTAPPSCFSRWHHRSIH